ncbi:hypothetical protein Mext_0134 [Methylorubrum extorquens PA1]|nr:hypothetical protein Mext_0134 [Methylorubrum extorquens PA1]
MLRGHAARHAVLALTASCLVLGSALHAQAAGEGDFGGLFQQLFSPQPTPAAQPIAPFVDQTSSSGQVNSGPGLARRAKGRWDERQSARRRQLKEPQAQVKPKVRYASLPKVAKVAAPSDKEQRPTAALDLRRYAGDPDAAFMHDSTLRKGDIVITTSGPKVFKGKTGERHAATEFELAGRSSAVDRKTRKLLAAMVTPYGALPAYEADKLLAKQRRLSDPSSASAGQQVQTANLRVVYPSGLQGAAVRVSLQGN